MTHASDHQRWSGLLTRYKRYNMRIDNLCLSVPGLMPWVMPLVRLIEDLWHRVRSGSSVISPHCLLRSLVSYSPPLYVTRRIDHLVQYTTLTLTAAAFYLNCIIVISIIIFCHLCNLRCAKCCCYDY